MVLSRLRKSVSYANVTATLALLLALSAGTVYAVDKIGSSEIAKNAIKSKHVKRDSLKGADINESTLGQVPAAASATTAGSAESANPEAFAHVLANGDIDAANSKGMGSADVTISDVSQYCFTSLPFAPRGAQVTQDYHDATDYAVLQLGLGGIQGCPSGTQAFVWSTDAHSTGNSAPTNFFITFYR